MVKVHKIKILPRYFNRVSIHTKVAEVRFNDRDYKEGDWLVLEEWDGDYSGRCLVRQIVSVDNLDSIGLSGWVLLHMK